MKSSLKTIAIAVAAAATFATATASAAPPANIGGTTWTLQANRDSTQLTITSQSGPGAPGAATCRVISGELGTPPPTIRIHGWYCPSTGRIHFVHQNADSANAVRVFSGNISDDVPGGTLYMAGTMTILASAFGDFGEYNFSATRQ